jgi:hypothetical protein
MVVRGVAANEYLAVDQKTLAEAGLTGRLRLIVQPGEIRILPDAEPELGHQSTYGIADLGVT